MNTAVAQKHLAEATIAKVRRLILRRGGHNGIRGLSRAFRVIDDDGNQKLSKDEFLGGLKDYGIVLSTDELKAVWAYFDRNNDGALTVTEFITALRGGLNPVRRSLVASAFELFGKTKDGSITVDDLRARYDPTRHPAVVRGESTPEEVLAVFLESFDDQTNPDGIITKQEFEQYLAGLSASIDDDDYFAAMVRACWRLPGANADTTLALALQSEGGELLRESMKSGSAAKVGSARTFTTTQRVEEKENTVSKMALRAAFEKLMGEHRAVMLKHPMGFRGVGRLLRQRDVEGTRYLNHEAFIDCLWKNRLYADDTRLLQFLDTNQDGTVDYGVYMEAIMGELPPARQLLLERLWRKLPTDDRGRTDLTVVQKLYDAPDGISLNTFLDAWDARLIPDGKVRFNELVEWFIPLSAAARNDAAFEKLLRDQWRQ